MNAAPASPVPEDPENRAPRYLVGIDLGTTNSAVAFLDGQAPRPIVRDFAIPQQVGPAEWSPRPVLPSFSYQWAEGESGNATASGGAEFPGAGAHVVGEFARERGLQTPGRLVSSAKSWLCHPGVPRTAPILPWHATPDVTRISPVEASARYLAHLRAAWDRAFPSEPLALQDVALTVPASFDEVARELTVQAAAKAGLPRLTLLEEPQAAFYAWMAAHPDPAEPARQAGKTTLVCDVGGGTSDFTLIEARATTDGATRFHRLAVGDHLLLGGDNMDLALAHHLESRLCPGQRLDPRCWGLLLQACRGAKESLLGSEPPESRSVSISGGARVVGGALQASLSQKEANALLVDGFFPGVAFNERPVTTRAGFREFGLPFASDPGVTRHLAAFLSDHSELSPAIASRRGMPDFVLFNGGVFESPRLQERLLEVLNAWRVERLPGSEPIHALPHARLDLAVARGAAFSRWLRREPQSRIAAGLSRTHYLGVGTRAEGTTAALCLAPAGLEEGREIVLPQRFQLRLRQPVEFVLFQSSTRLNDQAGDLVAVDTLHLTTLPPLRTVVSSGRNQDADSVDVRIEARLTEIGTLDLRCVECEGRRSWKLEFDVRGQSRSEAESTRRQSLPVGTEAVESTIVDRCRLLVRQVYALESDATEAADPAQLVRQLEAAVGRPRDEWPLPLLRALWSELMTVEAGRRRGAAFEARWLNLLGFALRPGFGFPVDDWRVAQTWRLFAAGTAFPRNEMCRAEWCILWRRVAAGLGSGHQRALGDAFSAAFRPRSGKKILHGTHELSEIWRLLGSLELLPVTVRTEIGQHFLERLGRRQEAPLLRSAAWSLGRLGARVPLHGPLNTILPPETAATWLEHLLASPPADPELLFTVAQLARRTGDRFRDLSDVMHGRALHWLTQHGASPAERTLVESGGLLDASAESHVFGESLPPGLHLDADAPMSSPTPATDGAAV